MKQGAAQWTHRCLSSPLPGFLDIFHMRVLLERVVASAKTPQMSILSLETYPDDQRNHGQPHPPAHNGAQWQGLCCNGYDPDVAKFLCVVQSLGTIQKRDAVLNATSISTIPWFSWWYQGLSSAKSFFVIAERPLLHLHCLMPCSSFLCKAAQENTLYARPWYLLFSIRFELSLVATSTITVEAYFLWAYVGPMDVGDPHASCI